VSDLYIQRSPIVAFRRLGLETMVMSAADSTLYNLNEVATVIWEAADGRTPLADIVRCKVCEQFEVGAEEACRDAEELVRNLAERGILYLSEHPLTASAGLAKGNS